MAIDPAMHAKENVGQFPDVSDLSIETDKIYAFDFDGVLTSRFEDDIYKLPPIEEERELLADVARTFGIRCDGMDQQYQRHLLFQAAAWKTGLEISAGNGFVAAKEASDHAKLFILTARSGWHAIERFRAFVVQHGLAPVETYHVGRVPKDRQVELLTTEFVGREIVYADDSLSQLELISTLNLNHVSLYHCNSGRAERSESELRAFASEVMQASLKAS